MFQINEVTLQIKVGNNEIVKFQMGLRMSVHLSPLPPFLRRSRMRLKDVYEGANNYDNAQVDDMMYRCMDAGLKIITQTPMMVVQGIDGQFALAIKILLVPSGATWDASTEINSD